MLGFVKGRYVPSLRLKVTSKKLMTCLFASIVILSPFEVKPHNSFHYIHTVLTKGVNSNPKIVSATTVDFVSIVV